MVTAHARQEHPGGAFDIKLKCTCADGLVVLFSELGIIRIYFFDWWLYILVNSYGHLKGGDSNQNYDRRSPTPTLLLK